MPVEYALTYVKRLQVADNVFTFTFACDNLSWRAGQYMALQFPDISTHLSEFEHWFTISSAPYQGVIEFTMRISKSTFKQRMLTLKPGEIVSGHTVDGDFSWPIETTPIFVAGGIGITPFISMLRQRLHEQKPLESILYYFSRPGTPILFEDELLHYREIEPSFKLHLVHAKPLSLVSTVSNLVDVANRFVYIAGPVPMVDRIGQELVERGGIVYRDFYFGYDVRNY